MEKRILFDTSVYGKLVDDTLLFALILERKQNHEFIIYGTDIIRKELRATPITLFNKTKDKKIRIFSLSLYDALITKDNHHLRMNDLIQLLAYKYIQEYKRQGGNVGAEELRNDFLLIASATIYHLDIVVSDDRRTMLSESAQRAYTIVNKNMGLRNPVYLLYNLFRTKIFKRSGI